MNDEYESPPMYFGNDEQQTQVIESLEAAIKAGKSKMHMVSGGPSSGKSGTLAELNNGMKGFELLADPQMISDDDLPNDIPSRLRELLRDMDFGNSIYVQHHVYKSHAPNASGKDVFVVVADGETPLTDRNALDMLDRAAALVGDSKKGYELLWVADVPVRLQSIPIFSNHSAEHELGKHKEALKQFEAAHPKQVKMHQLKYDMPTIRDALWDAIQQDGQDFIDAFRQTTHTTRDPANLEQWEKACKAALEGDKKAYLSAFRTLAARAKADKPLT